MATATPAGMRLATGRARCQITAALLMFGTFIGGPTGPREFRRDEAGRRDGLAEPRERLLGQLAPGLHPASPPLCRVETGSGRFSRSAKINLYPPRIT